MKELIEEHYECDYELFVEFTGLISWTTGAKIGWHSDSDRPYLKQRHFTAVCYLNSHEYDFQGGLFHFKEGVPTTVVPSAGDILFYRAEDVHCVDEISDGERLTLALWFTLDSSYDEDVKLLESISRSLLNISMMGLYEDSISGSPPLPNNIEACNDIKTDIENGVNGTAGSSSSPDKKLWMPLCASSSMYLLTPNEEIEQEMTEFSSQYEGHMLNIDIRVARLKDVGFKFCICTTNKNQFTALGELDGLSRENLGSVLDALDQPVKLKFKGHEYPDVFANSIHALQVVYFSEWKRLASACRQICSIEREGFLYDNDSKSMKSCSEVRMAENLDINDKRGESIQNLCAPTKAINEKETVLSGAMITREGFPGILLVDEWEQYMTENWDHILRFYPIWKSIRCLSHL